MNKPLIFSSTNFPSVADLTTIAAITDPVLRNLLITESYCKLSRAFATRTGSLANWCTFATWASKQAGQTIRGEDFRRTIENVLKKQPGIEQSLSLIATLAKQLGNGKSLEQLRQTALAGLIKASTEKAGAAVARGNKKVFEEIALEFARFIDHCFHDVVYDETRIKEFCSQLRTGDPPEGQQYLRLAFTRYYISFFETDVKKRTELCLLANLEIGFHEQTRLQPEIAESLNAAIIDQQQMKKLLLNLLMPAKNNWGRWLSFFQIVTRNTSLLEKAIDSLILKAAQHIRQIITAALMTLTLPPDNPLRLGHDLVAGFPTGLQQISNQELVAFLKKVDATENSLQESGAIDWADLQERLHFIADLFRCYHEKTELFDDAFTKEQVAVLMTGSLPGGRL